MKRGVALIAATGLLTGHAGAAQACVFLPVMEYRLPNPTGAARERLREECWQLRWERYKNLQSAERGNIDAAEAIDLAADYERTTFGCPGDRAFGFKLVASLPLETIIGSPQAETVPALTWLSDRLPAFDNQISPARARAIRQALWLRGSLATRDTFQPDAGEIDAMLADPGQRALVFSNHFANPALWSALSDPGRPWFNRALFAEMLLRGDADRPELLRATTLMMDPAYGPADLGLARRLLLAGPFALFDHDADPAIDAAGIALWRQVGELMAQSSDPAERARGLELASTGDFWGDRRTLTTLPPGARMINEWPAQLGVSPGSDPVTWQRTSARIAQYPRRALRTEESGPVETALHYAPDGTLVGFVVIRSSGSASLDQAAVDGLSRYFRPRPPAALPGDMIDGRDLFIRMPRFEYHLYPAGSLRNTTAERLVDGTIKISQPRIAPRQTWSDCGPVG